MGLSSEALLHQTDYDGLRSILRGPRCRAVHGQMIGGTSGSGPGVTGRVKVQERAKCRSAKVAETERTAQLIEVSEAV